jgi:hypothetical protein
MATFTITHAMRLDGYAVVQTLEATEIGIGQSITITGATDATFNGTFTVLAVPVYRYDGIDTEGDFLYEYDDLIPNQLLFADAGNDVQRGSSAGTITWTQTCTWITKSAVEIALGYVPAGDDATYLTTCTNAANAFAFRRRKAAGYFDSLTTSPSGDVTLGTTLYAMALYRERGSVDSFASFQDMTITAAPGTMGQIMRLLGVNRSQVA